MPCPCLAVLPLAALSTALACGPAGARSVAVTFDDLPAQEYEHATAAEAFDLNQRILAELKRRSIPAVGFVNEVYLETDGRLDPKRVACLAAWIDAGLELGNHTRSHLDLHRVPLARYENDVLRGEAVTRRLVEARGGALRWFRYPYLHTGADLETKRAFEAFLAQRGYRVAPVTIATGEWVFARAYQNARRQGDDAGRSRIAEEYVAYLERKTDYFERQSMALFGREIPQVLLVHANRLNADHFARVATMLERRGYRFVTLEAAMADPAYASPDTVVRLWGASWIHRWALSLGRGDRLVPDEPMAPESVLRRAGVESE